MICGFDKNWMLIEIHWQSTQLNVLFITMLKCHPLEQREVKMENVFAQLNGIQVLFWREHIYFNIFQSAFNYDTLINERNIELRT